MSARETIFANLITRVQAVTIANGYATDVVSPVDKNVLPKDSRTIPDGKAYVSIFDDGDGAPIQYGASNRILLELRFVLVTKITSTQYGLVPTALANNWMGDMRKLVYTLNATPSLLGSNCESVEAGEVAWTVSDTDALIPFPVKILYWMDQATP